MPLDALCVRGLVQELNKRTAGGRIDKIYQPDKEEIVISIRSAQGNCKLMLTASASAPRLHLIEMDRENPAVPPMFCMLLRKHLQGSKICSVTQPDLERMAVIEFDTTDEMGIPAKKYLICEMMGKYSNIILCDQEKRILDAIKRVDGDISGKRQVLPGLFYRMPPPQEKLDPSSVSATGLLAALQQAEGEEQADRWLLQKFKGLSPLICRELLYQATGEVSKPICELTQEDGERLARCWSAFSEKMTNGPFVPYLLTRAEDHSVLDFCYLPIAQYGDLAVLEKKESFSQLLGAFYEKKAKAERMKHRTQEITKVVTLARDRLRKKIGLQKKELDKTQERDRYKQTGELITANLYQIKKGVKKVKVINYFDESCPEVEISLDLRLTPQQNAAQYFKKYNKAKTAEIMLTEQIQEGEHNLSYLESVLDEINRAESEQDLVQIREELLETGYLSKRQQRGKGKRQPRKPSMGKPWEYRTSDGFAVFAGRNNMQNDQLTLKTAWKHDIWFHTQKIHGSHVILVCDGREPTDTAMTEAAEIAAYHSKAKTSAMVPVDYSEVKNIKKPNGAKPGMVIYHVYQTAFVTPDEEKVLSLRVAKS